MGDGRSKFQLLGRKFYLGLAGVLLLGGCGKTPPENAGPGRAPAEVTVVTLAPQSVTLTTDLPGRTSPYRIADVRPQISGVILKRMFTEGGLVQAQQQLYQIDPAPYEAAEKSAEAALDHAKAEFASANAQGERYQALKNSNAISKADFDTAISNQGQAHADVESAQAALDTAKINLIYTKVLSPISGRTGRSITEGALVTANQTTSLVTVQQLDPIYVDIPQSTSLLLRYKREIASGQIKAVGDNEAQVTLTLEDGSKYDPPGKLQFAEVTVDQGTGAVILRAVFPNSSNLLLPGMFVTAHLEEGVSENALLVPQQCVTNDPQGNHTVLLVTNDSKVESRTIQTDRAIKDQWLVTGGLQAGDRVVVSGLQKAMPGATVHATEQSPAPAVP